MVQNPTYRGTVYPWHCDHMEHMNVMYYVGKFDEATWNLLTEIGITFTYMKQKNRGMAAVEQRLTYQNELYAGDSVVINSKIVEVRDKIIRFTHEMLKVETGELCATCELTAVHMDSAARKALAFPDELSGKLNAD